MTFHHALAKGDWQLAMAQTGISIDRQNEITENIARWAENNGCSLSQLVGRYENAERYSLSLPQAPGGDRYGSVSLFFRIPVGQRELHVVTQYTYALRSECDRSGHEHVCERDDFDEEEDYCNACDDGESYCGSHDSYSPCTIFTPPAE